MRPRSQFFTAPGEPLQRRYEALGSYFVEGATSEEVARHFGYSPVTVHQLASELRAGRTEFFRSSQPGPKELRKVATVRHRVLKLRSAERSITEIAAMIAAAGRSSIGQSPRCPDSERTSGSR